MVPIVNEPARCSEAPRLPILSKGSPPPIAAKEGHRPESFRTAYTDPTLLVENLPEGQGRPRDIEERRAGANTVIVSPGSHDERGRAALS